LRRSTADPELVQGPRLNIVELGTFRRGVLGRLARRVRGAFVPADVAAIHARGSTWKSAKYMRGDVVAVGASPFFAASGRPALCP
jgi:hypothetical protein